MPEDRTSLQTRETLLIRLRDPEDDASWVEFAELYTPLLYAYCRKREISLSDTEDIVQQAMLSISGGIKGFVYDPTRGKFKGWLFTILRNTVSNHFRKASRAPVTAAETKMLQYIESTPDESESVDWDRDYYLRMLTWAIEKIKPEFSERAWSIFEETALKDRDNLEVGAAFGISKNAVAITRHRVTRRLQEKLQSIDSERWEAEMSERSLSDF